MSFDLDKILGSLPDGRTGGAQRTSELSEKSTNNKKSKSSLSNKYVEIPKSSLSSLPSNTYVRYKDLDGDLKPGGGILREVVGKDNNQMIRLYRYDKVAKKHFNWLVKLNEISKIYKYVRDEDNNAAPSTIQEPQKVDSPKSEEENILNQLGNKMLFNDNDILKQKVDLLEAEITKLATDQKKMLSIIKRLYQTIHQNSAPSAT